MSPTNRPNDGRFPETVRESTVLLRAAAINLSAADLLYVASDLLTAGRNPRDRAVNATVIEMVRRLLRLPAVDPNVVESVLRNLPESER